MNAFAGGCDNIMAIGGLNEDSEGLLLLTTDGKTARILNSLSKKNTGFR
jgi:16S rRNA U516 pseudouridylate synthase RsuA-like enzyme